MSKRDWKAFRRPDYRLRVVRLYGEGMTPMDIAIELDIQYQTVMKYIYAWTKNRFGISKEDLQVALANYERWNRKERK